METTFRHGPRIRNEHYIYALRRGDVFIYVRRDNYHTDLWPPHSSSYVKPPRSRARIYTAHYYTTTLSVVGQNVHRHLHTNGTYIVNVSVFSLFRLLRIFLKSVSSFVDAQLHHALSAVHRCIPNLCT